MIVSVPESEKKTGLFYFGIFIGVYGNLMASFYEKIVFPDTIDKIYYSQLFLMLIWVLSFLFYVITAYERKNYSATIWLFHVISPFLIIFNQTINIMMFEYPNFYTDILFCFLNFYFLILVHMSDWLAFGKYHTWQLGIRWKRRKFRIGILNDMEWEENVKETRTWTDISPSTWKKGFCQKKYQIDFITNKTDFERYVAIINPYGGVYPEADLKTLETHNKILRFVRDGGVFVNVADIPTYWAYNENLKRRIDHTEAIYIQKDNRIQLIKPFKLTPLMKELGLNVLGADTNPIPQNLDGNSTTHYDFVSRRVAVKVPNMISIIPEKNITTSDGEISTSAMFFIMYGEGEFLISLMFINDSSHDEKSRYIMRDTIINSLISVLNRKKEVLK